MREGYAIRMATGADADVIAYHRVAMFRDMGILRDEEMPSIEAVTRTYLAEALPRREYVGFMVEADGSVVAGGGLFVRRLLPRPGWPTGGDEAYVLNVYTEPAHRRRGLARALMEAIMAWCDARGMSRVTLHASDDGRPLYETLGFLQTNEMRWEAERPWPGGERRDE